MTETLTDELVIENPFTPTKEKEKPAEETDLRKLSQKKPPSRGLCRRCGENKPINRLMLCYPCWVKSELEKDFPKIELSGLDVLCPGCKGTVKVIRRAPNGKSGGWCKTCNRGVGA